MHHPTKQHPNISPQKSNTVIYDFRKFSFWLTYLPELESHLNLAAVATSVCTHISCSTMIFSHRIMDIVVYVSRTQCLCIKTILTMLSCTFHDYAILMTSSSTRALAFQLNGKFCVCVRDILFKYVS